MNSRLLHKLDRLARNLIPIALSAVLVVFSALPFYIPGYGQVAANFTLMSVFYWSVSRPHLMSPLAIFPVGVFQDIITGMPPGLNALVLILARTLVVTQGKVFHGKSFLVLWWGFAMVALGAEAVIWIFESALNLVLLNPLPGLVQWGLTVALYPFVAWFFARAHQAVIQEG